MPFQLYESREWFWTFYMRAQHAVCVLCSSIPAYRIHLARYPQPIPHSVALCIFKLLHLFEKQSVSMVHILDATLGSGLDNVAQSTSAALAYW